MAVMYEAPVQHFKELFDIGRYPAGEPHVQLLGQPPMQFVVADVRDFNDLCLVITADRIISHAGYLTPQWVIPYFPFARHDRRNHAGDGVELYLAMELAAEINPIIVDPHSDVTARMRHVTQTSVVEAFCNEGLFDADNLLVAIPDGGAAKKAHKWLDDGCGQVLPHIQCTKVRNPNTGQLTDFVVGEPHRVAGRDVVIVDDICDGGGTFLGLADELYKAGANSLTLAVTHGLFTKGLDDLMEQYLNIFTLDTCPLEHDRLVKVPLADILQEGSFL